MIESELVTFAFDDLDWDDEVRLLLEAETPVVQKFDIGGAVGIGIMAVMLAVVTLKNTSRLYREERIG